MTNLPRGSGDSHHLGHGSTDHTRKPRVIDALAPHHIKDIAAGTHHCLAVTEQGEVFGWGANASSEVEAKAGDSLPVPSMLSEASHNGVVYISCGSHEVCMNCIGNVY